MFNIQIINTHTQHAHTYTQFHDMVPNKTYNKPNYKTERLKLAIVQHSTE